jgi:hypothetical protein
MSPGGFDSVTLEAGREGACLLADGLPERVQGADLLVVPPVVGTVVDLAGEPEQAARTRLAAMAPAIVSVPRAVMMPPAREEQTKKYVHDVRKPTVNWQTPTHQRTANSVGENPRAHRTASSRKTRMGICVSARRESLTPAWHSPWLRW